jgi:hypothetical protein
MDEPPAISTPAPSETGKEERAGADGYDLPETRRADGSLVIDLTALAPVREQCVEENPDPFNPTIMVCARTAPDPRLGPVQGPADEQVFGSAVPRARVKLSENAEAEANVIKQAVGGFDADGGEVRLKIEF